MVPTIKLQSKRYHKTYEKLRRKAVEQDAREEQNKNPKERTGAMEPDEEYGEEGSRETFNCTAKKRQGANGGSQKEA